MLPLLACVVALVCGSNSSTRSFVSCTGCLLSCASVGIAVFRLGQIATFGSFVLNIVGAVMIFQIGTSFRCRGCGARLVSETQTLAFWIVSSSLLRQT